MMKHATYCTALLIVILSAVGIVGQSPAPVVGITSAEIDSVLKYTGSEGAGTDRQMRVVDLGSYRLGVGVLHRGPTRIGAAVGAISHSQVTEVFYIISGGGVLVTGGPVANEQPFPPATEFVRLAVGPSTGGTFKEGARRRVAPGDVIVVPAGVPHGFDEITDQVTYLSVRPDVAGVLPPGYVHPALEK
jgi:mannose-6-phosphate isomerase-like protein (cupin superfamily)